eukprot:Pompholyxophrys_punicea_v1_NODE_1026_length_1031_cov_2.469262.p2 type:complete len:142 gc:universal NODE_1026_length_1031_cov_2.469262:733-308(-)
MERGPELHTAAHQQQNKPGRGIIAVRMHVWKTTEYLKGLSRRLWSRVYGIEQKWSPRSFPTLARCDYPRSCRALCAGSRNPKTEIRSTSRCIRGSISDWFLGNGKGLETSRKATLDMGRTLQSGLTESRERTHFLTLRERS